MDISKVAKEFRLSASSAVQVTRAILSKVYIVDDKYIFRSRTLEPDTLRKFKNEQDLIATIRDLVPIKFPELFTTDEGNAYVVDEKVLWTAYPLIKGEVVCSWWNLEKLTEEQKQNTFITLRELHINTLGRLSNIDIKSQYHFLDDVRSRLATIGDDISESERQRIQKAIDLVAGVESALVDTDLSFVHGDYHPGNTIFDGNRVTALLDFDAARKGYYLEDFSYTLMMFLRDYTRGESFEFSENYFKKFVSWYGIPQDQMTILKEYLLLYTFYDTHLFRDLAQLPNQKLFYAYQKTFLSDLCARFN